MYSFLDDIKKLIIGVFITIIIFFTGNWMVNNIKTYETKQEIIESEVVNIRKVYNSGTKTYKYKLYINDNNKEIVVTRPKAIIKEMYRNKEEYIGGVVMLIKNEKYNKNNQLIRVGYELKGIG